MVKYISAKWKKVQKVLDTSNPRVYHLDMNIFKHPATETARIYKDADQVCHLCHTTQKVTLHHIVPRRYIRKFPESMEGMKMGNLVPLCRDCHDRVEARYRRLGNNQQEVKQSLSAEAARNIWAYFNRKYVEIQKEMVEELISGLTS